MTDATKLPYQERYQTKNATCGWRPPPSGCSSPGPPWLAPPASSGSKNTTQARPDPNRENRGRWRLTGEKGEKVAEVVVPRRDAVASSAARTPPRLLRRQEPSSRAARLDRFRAEDGVERPGMARFHSGPGLNERLFLVRLDFEPAHVVPGGTGRIPGHYRPKRTRP